MTTANLSLQFDNLQDLHVFVRHAELGRQLDAAQQAMINAKATPEDVPTVLKIDGGAPEAAVEPTPKPVKATKPKPEPVAPTPEPASGEPTATAPVGAAPEISYDKDIAEPLRGLIGKGAEGRAAAVALLGRYDAKKGPDLKPTQWPVFLGELKAVIADLAKGADLA